MRLRIVVTRTGMRNLQRLERQVRALASDRAREEIARGVADAGRMTKTRVQKAVAAQMAVVPGRYQSHVVANTRGDAEMSRMAYEIYAVKADQSLDNFKGLRVLSAGGKAARSLAVGQSAGERGRVRSGVWGNARLFQRSFEGEGSGIYFGGRGSGLFARLPAKGQHVLRFTPRESYTFGAKPGQARGADGRFGPGAGVKVGKKRKLYGPALRKELVVGNSLSTFRRVGSELVREKVGARLRRLLKG